MLEDKLKSSKEKAGIEIHTYGLGPWAVSAPFTLTQIARITGGHFYPISDPSQIVHRLKDFLFARLESLAVENATLNRPTKREIALSPDLRSFDELKLELEKEKERWLELNRKTREIEIKVDRMVRRGGIV